MKFGLGIRLDRWKIPLIWDLEKSIPILEKILGLRIEVFHWKYPINLTRNILILETEKGNMHIFVMSALDCIKTWHVLLARRHKLPTIFLVAFNMYASRRTREIIDRRLGILYVTPDELTDPYEFFRKLNEVWKPYRNMRCEGSVYSIRFYSYVIIGMINSKIVEVSKRIIALSKEIRESMSVFVPK